MGADRELMTKSGCNTAQRVSGYKFELENGKIQKISFNIEITNTDRVLGSYDPICLTTLSVGAQKMWASFKNK